MRRFADSMTWAQEGGGFAINAAVGERMGFIRKTYSHLLVELLGVGAVTALTINTPSLMSLANSLFGSGIWLFFGVFMGLSWITRAMLAGEKPIGTQYFAAGLWVVMLGFLCAPLVAMVAETRGWDPVLQAFVLTSVIFTGLTAYVFFTKKDFSFMGGALNVVGWGIVGFLIIGSLWGYNFGSWMSLLIAILFGGWILYDTSQILHHRHVKQYVSASVDLLTDFVFLFINILSLFSRD